MKTLCCLLLLGAAGLFAAQNGSDDRDAQLLLQEGQERLKAGSPGTAKVTFETLIAVYPDSGLVDLAKDGIRAAEEQEEPAPIVRSIRFQGFKKVKAEEITRRLQVREARLALESPCDERCMDEAQTILSELLSEKGALKGSVRAETRAISPRSIEITFAVVKE
ncbi:MAG TPA: POTRA domain-containing protein [Bryobacteraceae bacterium]|nr:POTRA domain-containing protein [Bryobacteraceae bacterium]